MEKMKEVLDIRYKELEESKPILEVLENYGVFNAYGFEDTLRNMMKLEYIYEGDEDVFVDYSWERALSIDDEVYSEWVLEFFLTMYFDKDVDKSNLMTEKLASRERCPKRDLWMMSALEESRGVNLAWIIVDHLYKHAPGMKESSVICAGHYVTKIASSLGYCVDDEIKKCSEPIDCEYWTTKMLAEELDENNQCLLKETGMPTQAGIGSSEQRQEPRGGSYGLGGDDYFTSAMPDFGGNSSGYAVGGSSGGAGFDDEDMDDVFAVFAGMTCVDVSGGYHIQVQRELDSRIQNHLPPTPSRILRSCVAASYNSCSLVHVSCVHWSATLYNCYLVPVFMSAIALSPPRGSILLDSRHLRLQPRTCSLMISRQPPRHVAASDWPAASDVAVHVASTSAGGTHRWDPLVDVAANVAATYLHVSQRGMLKWQQEINQN
ncbi:hypothetical protein Tco_0551780 [Tanacetum coccineum]